jgi:hypothetical protein
MIAGLGMVAVSMLVLGVEPRPDYTRNAYVTPGSHYMKVYPRNAPAAHTSIIEGDTLARKRRATFAGLVGICIAILIAGLLLVTTSLLLTYW